MNISNSKYKNCYQNNSLFILNEINDSHFNINLILLSEKYQYDSSDLIIELTNNNIQIENKTEIIKQIINGIIDEFNKTELEDGKDKKIIDNDKVIILTTTDNQKNNEEKNKITMNLGQCENIIKKNYNISNNDSLYILQIITEEEGMKIPKIEYEVYYPLNSNNLTKLDLSLCNDTKIEISLSVKINGSIDKYNINSDYYNDICSTTTSESGTDISLNDRKNEFIDNNMSLCEENCELIEYNNEKGKAKCSCDIKLSISPNYDTKFNKNDFLKSFTDIKNIFNLNILKCYKTVLKLKSLTKNYGLCIIGFIIILYFITLLIFSIYSFNKLKKEIYNIIFSLKINSNPIKKNKIEIVDTKKRNKKKKKYLQTKNNNPYENKTDKMFNLNKKSKKEKYLREITQNIINNNEINIKNKNKIYKNKISTNIILGKKEFELNSLYYEEALKLDHRSYFEYYISLFKYNHPILFSFAPFDDYNSKKIKIFLFFFSLYLDFTINALFFTDDTMHKIYEDKGKFNLLYQIPQIIYSTLISKIFDTIIKNLALSKDNITEVKKHKVKIDLNNIHIKLLRTLKIKFILFFISTLIFLIFFGYYIIGFCGTYINTQTHFIKDSMISLILSLLIPFVLYLFPGIFRITALRVVKPTRKILYNLSLLLEDWLC